MLINLRQSRALIIVFLLTLNTVVLAQQPKTAAEYIERGIAAQGVRKHDEALREFAAALNLDPKNPSAQHYSGISYMALDKFADAVKAFRSVVDLYPQDPISHVYLGDALGAGGRIDEAINELKEAIKLDPKLVEAHQVIAFYYNKSGRRADAIRALSDAAQLRENDTGILLDLASTHFAAESYHYAIEFFNRVIALNPDLSGVHFQLGETYERLGQLQAATQAYQKAVNLGPTTWVSHT